MVKESTVSCISKTKHAPALLRTTLTSHDYAKLIRWLGWHRHRVLFNRTQVQKLLFICYGVELAAGRLIFNESPRMFPFGPVFAKSYHRTFAIGIPRLSDMEKDRFVKHPRTLINITNLVNRYWNVSASEFTRWSHQDGTPWHKTFSEQIRLEWGAEIKTEYVEEYFKSDKWQIGL